MNCHPKGDAPLQGEDSHIHTQNVQRGPDGKRCFRDEVLELSSVQKPCPARTCPRDTLSGICHLKICAWSSKERRRRKLARQLKDPTQNGGKTLEQIIHHVAEDSLVATGWNPGEGRTSPPLTQAEAGKKMREWVDKGAAIP